MVIVVVTGEGKIAFLISDDVYAPKVQIMVLSNVNDNLHG